MRRNILYYSASEAIAGHPDKIRGPIFEASLSVPLRQDFSFYVTRKSQNKNFTLDSW